MEGGVSDPRNPTIFKLFSLIEIGERAGSGIFNICTEWNRIEWKTPSLHEKFSPERTTFVLPVELENENLGKWVTEKVTENEKSSEEVTEKVTGNENSGEKVTVNAVERVTVNESPGEWVTVRVTENEKLGKKVTEKVTENTPERVTGNEDSDSEVTGNQKLIIENVVKNSQITTKELSFLIGISERKIKENISKLKSKGILERVGPDKGGYWRVKRSGIYSSNSRLLISSM